jgi:hypothetical protein
MAPPAIAIAESPRLARILEIGPLTAAVGHPRRLRADRDRSAPPPTALVKTTLLAF